METQDSKLMAIMNTLGDSTRFKLFKILSNEKGLCVGEIAERLNITASAVSQHFRLFESAGMVDKERQGQKICYCIRENDPDVRKIQELLTEGSLT